PPRSIRVTGVVTAGGSPATADPNDDGLDFSLFKGDRRFAGPVRVELRSDGTPGSLCLDGLSLVSMGQ
ncbi:MAG: hypothetical protein ACYC5J_09915, partial [Chloroflexota bacterium]